jgi:hypothetical protein
MIVYHLRCKNDHEFESWFQSSKAYDKQVKSGSVECPICASTRVSKAIMAPNIVTKAAVSTSHLEKKTVAKNAQSQAFAKMATAIRNHVESNFDYVGEKFPEEARRIHYGEADERGIYGEATNDETKALLEEGVEVAPLPMVPKRKTN